MHTKTALIVALALGLLALGAATAQDALDPTQDDAPQERPGKHRHEHKPFWERCDGNLTVDECKAQLEAEFEAHKQEHYEACVEKNGEDAGCERILEREFGDGPPHKRGKGPGKGPGGDKVPRRFGQGPRD